MEKKVLIIIVLVIISTVLAIGLFFQSVTNENSMSEESEKHDHTAEMAEGYYSCPMHPDVLEISPGACPVCGMKLTEKEA